MPTKRENVNLGKKIIARMKDLRQEGMISKAQILPQEQDYFGLLPLFACVTFQKKSYPLNTFLVN